MPTPNDWVNRRGILNIGAEVEESQMLAAFKKSREQEKEKEKLKKKSWSAFWRI